MVKRQAKSASQRLAMNHRDRRLRQAIKTGENFAYANFILGRLVRRESDKFVEVATGAECSSGATRYQHAHIRPPTYLFNPLAKSVCQLLVDCIQHCRPLQSQPGDSAFDLKIKHSTSS